MNQLSFDLDRIGELYSPELFEKLKAGKDVVKVAVVMRRLGYAPMWFDETYGIENFQFEEEKRYFAYGLVIGLGTERGSGRRYYDLITFNLEHEDRKTYDPGTEFEEMEYDVRVYLDSIDGLDSIEKEKEFIDWSNTESFDLQTAAVTDWQSQSLKPL